MENNHLAEKTVSSDIVYEGPIFTITHDTVELENKNTAIRDVLLHHGGVCVIPVTDSNEIYMVKQFRYPFKTVTVEVPAGKLEKAKITANVERENFLKKQAAFAANTSISAKCTLLRHTTAK